jgi:hypothetical protein
MSKRVGRNDRCPCGSGRKFKKCHLNSQFAERPAIAKPSARKRWQSADVQAKASRVFVAKLRAEKQRREQFGEVRPIIHTAAWDKKLIAVGSRIYFTDADVSFADFLRDYLRDTLGSDWWTEETAKPLAGRHQIAQWQAHAEELMRAEKPDGRGRFLIPRDGLITAYMTVAYDLYVVRDNTRFQEQMIDRLRRREHFAGGRYELLVAATFVRAGFQVEPEDESSPVTHPEFVATHRTSKFVLAVEAKARNRRATDKAPARVGVDDLIAKAATQAPKDTPFALFVEVAMPPEDRDKPPSWAGEVDQSVNDVVAKHGGMPGPFDWVIFTSIPHQYGLAGEPDPARHYMEWVPHTTRIPGDIREAIVTAVQQYGSIPEFETGS